METLTMIRCFVPDEMEEGKIPVKVIPVDPSLPVMTMVVFFKLVLFLGDKAVHKQVIRVFTVVFREKSTGLSNKFVPIPITNLSIATATFLQHLSIIRIRRLLNRHHPLIRHHRRMAKSASVYSSSMIRIPTKQFGLLYRMVT